MLLYDGMLQRTPEDNQLILHMRLRVWTQNHPTGVFSLFMSWHHGKGWSFAGYERAPVLEWICSYENPDVEPRII